MRAEELRPLVSFNANLWDPDATFRAHGYTTHVVDIQTGVFTFRPKRANRLRSNVALIYDWPTVVIEQHRPVPESGLLVDVRGRLGRLAIPARLSTLQAALEGSGFRVVVVRHFGWEKPRPVKPHEATLERNEVPASVLGG